jgi:hypothetical protein
MKGQKILKNKAEKYIVYMDQVDLVKQDILLLVARVKVLSDYN